MLTVPNSAHLLIGQLVKWIPGAGRCLWRFPIRTFPQAESLSRKYRVPQKRCSSSKFQTPAYFSSWREAAVCVSREHSGDVEVEMVLDIDRDELDNEIQDPFFENFHCIFSSQILLGIYRMAFSNCRYSDHSHDALHDCEAEFPLRDCSCLKGNLLRGSLENSSSPSGHRFPLSLIIAAWISCLVAFACHYEIPGLTTDKSLNISRFPKIATILQAEKVAGWCFHFENTQTPSDLQILFLPNCSLESFTFQPWSVIMRFRVSQEPEYIKNAKIIPHLASRESRWIVLPTRKSLTPKRWSTYLLPNCDVEILASVCRLTSMSDKSLHMSRNFF